MLEFASNPLRSLRRRQAALEAQMEALGAPMVGQTVAALGYQSPRWTAPPLSAPWVQVDLQERHQVDWLALVPAQVDWPVMQRSSYGFPPRFRIDLSDDPEFHEFTTVADFTDADLPEPGLAPVAIRLRACAGRFVRLTATKLAVQNGQYFFALAELMVLEGNRDIAIRRPVRSSASFNGYPRWGEANLVDGWTPLGPPILRELLPYDGLYADAEAGSILPWMLLDLGRDYEIQEVRLHPVHARLGADVPGFDFPTAFTVELSHDAAFSDATVIFSASAPFPNPGNNPVILPAEGARGRYVRVRSLKETRIGLSELEVYAEGENVARQKTVSASPDKSNFSKGWPRPLLVDGYTSYGKLMEWPAWLEEWNRRDRLQREWQATIDLRPRLEAEARRRLTWGAFFGLVIVAGFICAVVIRERWRRAQEIKQLRVRLGQDLHDEIGSNLAALSMLSECAIGASRGADAKEDWNEVNRIARETTDSMREVLWLMGARAEAGVDLTTHLPLVAERMLPGMEVVWTRRLDHDPEVLDIEARRQIFLFFKEALANVVRHSAATKATLLAEICDDTFILEIQDNGRGFSPETAVAGMGLESLRARARALGAKLEIAVGDGAGARVRLALLLGRSPKM